MTESEAPTVVFWKGKKLTHDTEFGREEKRNARHRAKCSCGWTTHPNGYQNPLTAELVAREHMKIQHKRSLP